MKRALEYAETGGEFIWYAELQRQMGKSEVQIETASAIPEAILSELSSLPGINVREANDRLILLSTGNGTDIPDIVNFLVSKNVRIEQVKRREASVEEIYTSILKEVEPR